MKIFVSLALVCGLVLLLRLYDALVVKPNRLRAMLTKQGISGPTPTLLLGNIRQIKSLMSGPKPQQSHLSHNVASFVFPFLDQWRHKYGSVFTFSLGNTQILCVNKAEMVREITTCTSLDLGKPSYQQKEHGPLLGQGILTSNGPFWAHQRKILAPPLFMDKVKGMTNIVMESTTKVVEKWKSRIEMADGAAEIEIGDDMRSFSGEVISRACFGSDYANGEDIFVKLRALQATMSKKGLTFGVPGMRYLPTKSNREAWALEKEIQRSILKVVKERQSKGSEEDDDLLQLVLDGAESSELSQEGKHRFIVDNCKNIYFAGYETTSVAATWCLMLLASNQDWQDRVRQEVVTECAGRDVHFDMLRKFKQLTMVIHESLRLYPPVPLVSREAFKEMRFGDVAVPKGVDIWTMAVTLHTDPEIWGSDSYTFNPDRFRNGVAGSCKLPYLYVPFGAGPRVCLGQNLAIVELKVLLARLLKTFSFTLSPNYRHSPTLRLVIEPQDGVILLVNKL